MSDRLPAVKWTMTDGLIFEDCRRAWQAGRCPCCGGHLIDWFEVQPGAVAEGVMFCGRCIAMHHHDDPPEFLPRMLAALLPEGGGISRLPT